MASCLASTAAQMRPPSVCSVWREQHTVAAMRIYHQQNVSMPEDMFGAYLRNIKKDLVFKEKLRAESAMYTEMTM